MAKDKKSFVAYADWIESFEELSDEEAGRLIKHLLRYVNDLNPEAPDKLTKMCFIPIKSTLKRDLDKYEITRERNAKNGAKGGRPKKSKVNPKKAVGLIDNPNKPKKADSVSDSVSDSEREKKTPRAFNPLNQIEENKAQLKNKIELKEHYKFLKEESPTIYDVLKRSTVFEKVSQLPTQEQINLVDRFNSKCLEEDLPYDAGKILGRFKGYAGSWITRTETNSKKGML